MAETNRIRRLGVAAAWVASVAVAAGGAWWGAQQTVAPPDDPLPEARPATYTVEEGSVGRSMSFSATAEWDLSPLAVNAAAGTVTGIDVEPGSPVEAGDVLYRVDLRPVVVGEGAVPSFRDLARGAEGPDVEQLQALLATLGHLDGAVDGDFGSRTHAAVRDWQDDLGLDDDGVVREGDVVWVPSLPARVALDETVRVGARLAGGEEVVLLVPDEPDVRIELSVEQRDLVPLSAEVRVHHTDGTWDGRIARAEEFEETRQLNLVLEGAEGGPICAPVCMQEVPIDTRASFGVDITVIPETHGPIVPVSALTTDAGGAVHLTGADGAQMPVTVVGASDGLAVVDGVDAGAEVLVFEPEADADQP